MNKGENIQKITFFYVPPLHKLGLRLPFRVRVGETVVVLRELQENIWYFLFIYVLHMF